MHDHGRDVAVGLAEHQFAARLGQFDIATDAIDAGMAGDLHVNATMNAYTTAAGNLVIDGLPGAPASYGSNSIVATGQWSRISLTAGYTQISGLIGTNQMQLRMSETGVSFASVTTTNVPASTSGFAVHAKFWIPGK